MGREEPCRGDLNRQDYSTGQEDQSTQHAGAALSRSFALRRHLIRGLELDRSLGLGQ